MLLVRVVASYFIPVRSSLLIPALLLVQTLGSAQTRDPWLHPFSADSIWNTSLGSGADYQSEGALIPLSRIGSDTEFLYRMHGTLPKRELRDGVNGRVLRKDWPISDDIVLRHHLSNNCAAFLLPDGKSVLQLQPFFRPEKGGIVSGIPNPFHGSVDLFKDGIIGTHWGSGLSALGGSIRHGELTGDKPIRHALKMDVWCAKSLHHDPAKDTTPGFTWPATVCDGYAADPKNPARYLGATANPSLVQGALLALHPRHTPESLGLTTHAGKQLFHALRDYGCYIVDDSAQDAYFWCVEREAQGEFEEVFGYSIEQRNGHPWREDCMRLITHLSIITNNTAQSIGGPGERRQPPAPPFGKLDETPPTMPAGVVVTSTTPQTISLKWKASTDDQRVTGYDVLHEGQIIGESFGAAQVTLSGLKPRSQYAPQVRARDGSGHYSALTEPLQVKTPPLPPGIFLADFDAPDAVNWSFDHAKIDRGNLQLQNWGGSSRATLAPLFATGAWRLGVKIGVAGGGEANVVRLIFHELDAKNHAMLEITGGGEKAFVRLKRVVNGRAQLLAETRGWQNGPLFLETDEEGRITAKTGTKTLFESIADPAKPELQRGGIGFAGQYTESSLDDLRIEGTGVLLPTMTVLEARSTPREQARQKVRATLGGVLVHRDPQDLTLVLQDATDAIWIPARSAQGVNQTRIGQRVLIEGMVSDGNYAPTFIAERIHLLGSTGLPAPKQTEASLLLAGADDCHFVEVSGIVRAVLPWPAAKSSRAMIHLDVAGTRIRVLTAPDMLESMSRLVDARLRVRGICTLGVNSSGQVLNAQVRISEPTQIEVTQPPPAADTQPLTPLSELLRFGSPVVPGHRIRTRGIVSAVRPDEWVQVQDGERGVRVWTHTSPHQPALGDDVEVLGFPAPGPFSPQIQDGAFKIIGKGAQLTPLLLAKADDARMNDGRLVTITARLIEAQAEASPARLLLQDESALFAAEFATPIEGDHSSLESGAQLQITGISDVNVGKEWQDAGYPKARSFTLHLRGINDVKVLRPAPWWTPARLAAALAAALAALVTVLFFAGALGNKNKRLREAEADLTAARDALAKRVEVRTDQLQAQLATRREEFADYAAVTAERNRLARDLHDSLEQTLAGAALRMEAASESLPGATDDTRSHLAKATELLRLSQTQVRRTVWGLRSLALEKKTLSDAIRESVKLLTDDSGLRATLHLLDGDTGLTPEQDNELLHIAHEAIANILKHSRATEFSITLLREHGRFQMLIEDNGRGFDPEEARTRQNGRPHYGLRDMQERAEIIAAKLSVESKAGETRVRVDL
jgi:signal transduction histidine kinase